MMKTFSWVCVFLVAGSGAWGQRRPATSESAVNAQVGAPSNTPESVVQSALRNSPEIRKAELAVEAAQAELALVRAKITRDAIAVHSKVTNLRDHKLHVETRVNTGTSPQIELQQVLMALAEVEAELKYLTGSGTSGIRKSESRPEPFNFFERKPVPVKRPQMDKGSRIVEILSNPVGITFEDILLTEITRTLTDNYDLNFNIDATLFDYKIPYINLKDVSMLDALLAFAEQNEEICFVIRDYGIFVTTRERAVKIPGPTIPANIPYFE
jgi:hypothetical protein